MYIKIYFADKPVYLCDALNNELHEILQHPDAVFIDEIGVQAIRSLLHEIKKEEFHAGVILNNDLEKLKTAFFRNFNCIEAAGGIVLNKEKEILFIYRLGKWDLPKGKMEKDEEAAACAKREVTEETGIKNLTIKHKVGETYHCYDQFGKHFLKISHWYYMTSSSNQQPIPQTIEYITDARWIKSMDIREPMQNTYPAIKDILSKFFDEP